MPAQNIWRYLFPRFRELALLVIFRLMIPSKHFCPASNTPDPEFPVVATSRITVENLFWTLAGSNAGNITWERAVPSGTATMTGSPGHGPVFTQRHAAHLQING